jgi:hypothetical protein
MGMFGRPARHPDPTDGRADFSSHDSDTPLSITDLRLPSKVRSLGETFGSDLAAIHRMNTDRGIEWWFMAHDGNLLESLWFE